MISSLTSNLRLTYSIGLHLKVVWIKKRKDRKHALDQESDQGKKKEYIKETKKVKKQENTLSTKKAVKKKKKNTLSTKKAVFFFFYKFSPQSL